MHDLEEEHSASHNSLKLGRLISRRNADEFEKSLAEKPGDLNLRIALIAHYRQDANFSDEAAQARLNHISWFLQNRSDHCVLRGGTIETLVLRDLEPQAFAMLKEQWCEEINKTPNVLALINASNFFSVNEEYEFAEQCLLRAKAVESSNSICYAELSNFYRRRGRYHEALVETEVILLLQLSESDRLDCLMQLSHLALLTGDSPRAKWAAEKSLLEAEMYKDDWNYGNVVHAANIVLGRIMLQEGDTERARQYLLLASYSDGSPQLSTFGPDFTLAKELLEAGDRDSVLLFLEKCKVFWQLGSEKLEKWSKAIRVGQIPWSELEGTGS
jgi:tetratricopeptide (TPR) repeat protein